MGLPARRKETGGAPANFAYHAGQFGFDTLAVSALGEDALGEETIAALEEHRLSYLMPRIPYPHGNGTGDARRAGHPLPITSAKVWHGTIYPLPRP